MTYSVLSTGRVKVEVCCPGRPGRPQLPLFGFRFSTPVPVKTVHWLGLSGETYPDRKSGGIFGWHRESPHIPDYLVPQECGCHTDTQKVSLQMAGGEELILQRTDVPFAFSAIPYTPGQLEQAMHREELPQPVRTVITVCGAMRGVGGIDSWGSDVEAAYQISAEKELYCSFEMFGGEN